MAFLFCFFMIIKSLVIVFLCILIACIFRIGRYNSEFQRIPAKDETERRYGNKETDAGDFVLKYGWTKKFVEYENEIRRNKLLEKID